MLPCRIRNSINIELYFHFHFDMPSAKAWLRPCLLPQLSLLLRLINSLVAVLLLSLLNATLLLHFGLYPLSLHRVLVIFSLIQRVRIQLLVVVSLLNFHPLCLGCILLLESWLQLEYCLKLSHRIMRLIGLRKVPIRPLLLRLLVMVVVIAFSQIFYFLCICFVV